MISKDNETGGYAISFDDPLCKTIYGMCQTDSIPTETIIVYVESIIKFRRIVDRQNNKLNSVFFLTQINSSFQTKIRWKMVEQMERDYFKRKEISIP